MTEVERVSIFFEAHNEGAIESLEKMDDVTQDNIRRIRMLSEGIESIQDIVEDPINISAEAQDDTLHRLQVPVEYIQGEVPEPIEMALPQIDDTVQDMQAADLNIPVSQRQAISQLDRIRDAQRPIPDREPLVGSPDQLQEQLLSQEGIANIDLKRIFNDTTDNELGVESNQRVLNDIVQQTSQQFGNIIDQIDRRTQADVRGTQNLSNKSILQSSSDQFDSVRNTSMRQSSISDNVQNIIQRSLKESSTGISENRSSIDSDETFLESTTDNRSEVLDIETNQNLNQQLSDTESILNTEKTQIIEQTQDIFNTMMEQRAEVYNNVIGRAFSDIKSMIDEAEVDRTEPTGQDDGLGFQQSDRDDEMFVILEAIRQIESMQFETPFSNRILSDVNVEAIINRQINKGIQSMRNAITDIL